MLAQVSEEIQEVGEGLAGVGGGGLDAGPVGAGGC